MRRRHWAERRCKRGLGLRATPHARSEAQASADSHDILHIRFGLIRDFVWRDAFAFVDVSGVGSTGRFGAEFTEGSNRAARLARDERGRAERSDGARFALDVRGSGKEDKDGH